MIDFSLAPGADNKARYSEYKAIYKSKGFNPNPLVSEDHKSHIIPLWADAKNNPACYGSPAYREFWNEQNERCLQGYTTAGIFIPGRYYYYLNFTKINTVLLGEQFPWYVDLDLEYFRLVDWVKTMGRLGIIAPKARRKGLSEKGQTVVNYGLRFIKEYRAGMAAGIDDYVMGFKTKMYNANKNIASEMRLNTLKRNEDEWAVGYEYKNEIGEFTKGGWGGIVRFATMYDNATKLEGEYFHDVILEESGQFPKLSEAYESIKPALVFGTYVGGTFYIYGTGGNIKSSSKDFLDMWYESDKLQLERFWVNGARMHFPYFGNNKTDLAKDQDTGEKIDGLPNFKKRKDYELIGVEDIKAAEQEILKKREYYAQIKNKKKLIKHNQSFPLTIEEAFTSSGSNNFNTELLYMQLHNIHKYGSEKVHDYVLEWKTFKDTDGLVKIIEPRQVTIRPFENKDPDWKKVRIYINGMPLDNYRNIDFCGVDAYNQDQTQTNESLGGIALFRNFDGIKAEQFEEKGIYPILTYYQRPPRKEQFFEIAQMIAVGWNLIQNMMMSAEQDLIIDYFKANKAKRYLSPRPKSIESVKSEQIHKYGVKMTGQSKPTMLGIQATYIEDSWQNIWFEELVRDYLAYDEENIGSDWDLADAAGNALIRIKDKKVVTTSDYSEEQKKWMNELPQVVHKKDGGFEIIVVGKAPEKLVKNPEVNISTKRLLKDPNGNLVSTDSEDDIIGLMMD